MHGHHGLAELLQIVSHLRLDHLLALNLLTAHVDTARHRCMLNHINTGRST